MRRVNTNGLSKNNRDGKQVDVLTGNRPPQENLREGLTYEINGDGRTQSQPEISTPQQDDEIFRQFPRLVDRNKLVLSVNSAGEDWLKKIRKERL